MPFITRLLLFPVTGPIHGLTWVLEQIREAAEAEMPSADQIEAMLVEASLQHQSGELTDEEYEEIENQLLDDLNAIRNLGGDSGNWPHGSATR
jgi:hypothetical protein